MRENGRVGPLGAGSDLLLSFCLFAADSERARVEFLIWPASGLIVGPAGGRLIERPSCFGPARSVHLSEHCARCRPARGLHSSGSQSRFGPSRGARQTGPHRLNKGPARDRRQDPEQMCVPSVSGPSHSLRRAGQQVAQQAAICLGNARAALRNRRQLTNGATDDDADNDQLLLL